MTDRRATVWVGVGFLCLYLLTASGHYGGDGFWSYLTAESLLLDGDLIVGDRPFLVREMHNQFTGNGQEGAVVSSDRLYSKYGLGLALLEIPFYGVGLLVSSAGVFSRARTTTGSRPTGASPSTSSYFAGKEVRMCWSRASRWSTRLTTT